MAGSDEDDLDPERMTIPELLRMSADRMLLLADRLEKWQSALLDVRKQIMERELAADERERTWAFAMERVVEAHRKDYQEALAKYHTLLEKILPQLAVLAKEVEDAGEAAEEAEQAAKAAKDASASHALVPVEREKRPMTELIQAFKELPTPLKALLIILASLVAGHTELAELGKWIIDAVR